jgi:hypothetical protein
LWLNIRVERRKLRDDANGVVKGNTRDVARAPSGVFAPAVNHEGALPSLKRPRNNVGRARRVNTFDNSIDIGDRLVQATCTLRQFASILLVCVFAALASGLVERLHNHVHAMEDALEAAEAKAAGLPVDDHPVHDESNCGIHAQMHMPMTDSGYVPLLVMVGLFVAFLTLLAPRVHSHRIPVRIDCRGPPAPAGERCARSPSPRLGRLCVVALEHLLQ